MIKFYLKNFKKELKVERKRKGGEKMMKKKKK